MLIGCHVRCTEGIRFSRIQRDGNRRASRISCQVLRGNDGDFGVVLGGDNVDSCFGLGISVVQIILERQIEFIA